MHTNGTTSMEKLFNLMGQIRVCYDHDEQEASRLAYHLIGVLTAWTDLDGKINAERANTYSTLLFERGEAMWARHIAATTTEQAEA